MEFLEELTGTKITAYSYYAAAGMFVFGAINLAVVKLLVFNRMNTPGDNATNEPTIVKSGDTVEPMHRFVWTFMMISSLVVLPVIAFVFFGEEIESIFSNLGLPVVNRGFG